MFLEEVTIVRIVKTNTIEIVTDYAIITIIYTKPREKPVLFDLSSGGGKSVKTK